ncbi:MAG: hypothetical protein AABZ31_13840 [Bdellovibrionota bacterium]
MRFTVFVGIDQAGAANKSGKPKPLPAAIVTPAGRQLLLSVSSLKGLTKESIDSFVENENLELTRSGELAIIVDCVLGLPEEVFPKGDTLFDLFHQANVYKHEGRAHGREVAYEFFKQFLDGREENDHPRRQCEHLAKANSVFALRPYQKNVGCGTFRIWKELGSKNKWFHLWPTERLSLVFPTIFEGYPSLIWKKIFGMKSRKPKELIEAAEKKLGIEIAVSESTRTLIEKNPNYADAAALALGAYYLQECDDLTSTSDIPDKAKEGWIVGLKP